jgi:uncharacterized membrane protein
MQQLQSSLLLCCTSLSGVLLALPLVRTAWLWRYVMQALYEGYFLDPAAAKQYVTLFQADREPYSADCLRVNADQLASLVSTTAHSTVRQSQAVTL